MPVKPSTSEEEYFAREDAEKKRKLALERQKQLAAQERDERKTLHWMKCPKCGMELHTIKFRDIEIDRCFSCSGTWLDEGELEKVASQEKEGAIVGSLLRIFKKG